MSFRIVFSDKALKQMKKLDKYTASLIIFIKVSFLLQSIAIV